MERLIEQAAKNLSDIMRDAIKLESTQQAFVLFDDEAPLSKILVAGYHRALPNGKFVDFKTVTPEIITQEFDHLKPGDIVILVQSTNFRLNEFRLRIELFKRGLKTIEHIHLNRMVESQFETYIDALAYDKTYYHHIGHGLKKILDQAQHIEVDCQGKKLVYDVAMEDTKLNIGDYTDMKNVGGTFPIGEVFTEAKDLTKVNGEALVYGFAGEDHIVRTYQPFLIKVENGILTAPEGPADFQKILDLIKEDEDVLVREFGLGLNRAMDKNRLVNDITAFERQLGLHLSLGAKHAMYPKPGLKRKEGRYHVDIFVDIDRITVDLQTIYENGNFTI